MSNTKPDVVRVESTAGKRQRRSKSISALADLQPGFDTTIVYGGRTRFPVWIAVQRQRLDKPFCWEPLKGRGKPKFKVWLEGTVAKTAAPQLNKEATIDWSISPLRQGDRRTIINLLDRARFAPRHGKGGGLIRAASDESGVPYFRAYRWLQKVLGKGRESKGTKWLGDPPEDIRRFLASFLRGVTDSYEATFVANVYKKAKCGDRVLVSLNKRHLGLLKHGLAKTSYTLKTLRAKKEGRHSYFVTLESKEWGV